MKLPLHAVFSALYLLVVISIQCAVSSASFSSGKKGNERIQIISLSKKVNHANQVSNRIFSDEDVLLKNPINKKIKKQQSVISQAKNDNNMSIPIVVNTWAFAEASAKAWEILSSNGSALDAVEKGCTVCEELQCDRTVGYGGSPDENGETTLDAMIMDGETHAVGAVACLRRIKSAISVARKVMEKTKHTILAGDLATDFAIKMGFKEESLTTAESAQMHQEWKNNSCQPNFWKNVSPDPTKSCGPYVAGVDSTENFSTSSARVIDKFNHDTIGMVSLDSKGRLASGTSSNGARNKIPGRVGDAPVVGAGSYVEKDIGGAAATGDGDVMMRFLPSLIAVEHMRHGYTPTRAAEEAVSRIVRFYPDFSGALVAVNIRGEFGAACHNIQGGFPYTVRNQDTGKVVILRAECI